jgi:aryl-alcohol dehydrogenase-like predicted oxidoreductase
MGDMRYRRLGDSGLVVSVVGLGCNNFGRRIDLDATRAVVDAAIEEGVTLFDTADIYGESETFLGEALQGRRDDIVLATKFGAMVLHGPDHQARAGRRYIRRAVESSLRRLRTDYIDLYQMHFPDPETPIDETLSALDDLVHEGKVRYIGISNATGWMVADADWTARTRGLTRFISVQNHYNLIERGIETDVVPACERYGLGVLPYFPLANGLLTWKYQRGKPAPEGTRLAAAEKSPLLDDRNFDAVERLEKFAAEHGRSILDVAIGGLAAQPAVASVIAGATKPDQVRANVVAGRWVPTAEELTELNAASRPASRR